MTHQFNRGVVGIVLILSGLFIAGCGSLQENIDATREAKAREKVKRETVNPALTEPPAKTPLPTHTSIPKTRISTSEADPTPTTNLIEIPATSMVTTASQIPNGTASDIANWFEERGYFAVCTRNDTPPFGYEPPNGKLEGFDIDLIKELGYRWLNIARNDDLPIIKLVLSNYVENFGEKSIEKILDDKKSFTNLWKINGQKGILLIIVSADNRIPCLQKGLGDLLIAAFSGTEKRCDDERNGIKCIDQIYFQDTFGLLVHKDSGIKSICDLDGKKLYILKGTTAEEYMDSSATWCNKGYEYGGPDIEIFAGNRITIVKKIVANPEVAYTTDRSILQGLADLPEAEGALNVEKGDFEQDSFKIAVSKSMPEHFGDLITQTLQEMKVDGAYDEIHLKAFKCEFPPFPILPNSPNPCEVPDNYTVKEGDTLGGIAHRFCGNWNLYKDIKDFNLDIREIENTALPIETILKFPPVCQPNS